MMTLIEMPTLHKRSTESLSEDHENPEAENHSTAKKPYKRSIAEGFMDITLLTANANQLKYIISYNQDTSTFYASLSLIVVSLILQVAIGFMLILRVSIMRVHRNSTKKEKEKRKF